MEILQHSYDDDPLFILADANAEPGEYDGETVQIRGFPTTANTPAFRTLLQSYGLYLPAASEAHRGPNGTWSHCNGLSQHCIDHIAIPLAWQQRCTHSEVLDAFDMATAHDDHKMAAIQLQWRGRLSDDSAACKQKHIKKAVKYCHRFDMHQQILQIAPQDWHRDVEHQTEHITQQLHDLLAANQAAECSSSKKPYVNQEIWEFRSQKIVLRKKIRGSQLQTPTRATTRLLPALEETGPERLELRDRSTDLQLRCHP